jgi:hypothetical protein
MKREEQRERQDERAAVKGGAKYMTGWWLFCGRALRVPRVSILCWN